MPLDLVNGGISRPPIQEGLIGVLIGMQLGLLVLFQWPVGRWLASQNPGFGLQISSGCFATGCLLLGLSSLWNQGIVVILLAQIPLAFGLASFLPTATEVIIKIPPPQHRGISMALFSQCFAISALVSPVVAGASIDHYGNGIILWIIMSILCICIVPLSNQIKCSIS